MGLMKLLSRQSGRQKQYQGQKLLRVERTSRPISARKAIAQEAKRYWGRA